MTRKTDSEQQLYLAKAKTLSKAIGRLDVAEYEALSYMRRYAGKTFVIKYGGNAMGNAELAKLFAHDIVLLKQVGIHPVVVHGGGPQIDEMLGRLKIKSSFVGGLRVTDKATIEIVEMVLSGLINKEIVSTISAAGGSAIGLSGKDGGLIQARKLQCRTRDENSSTENALDLGFVGEPIAIDPHILHTMERTDVIPVIAPIGFGANGETYNINADTAAGSVAAALGAERLLLLTNVAGISDKTDQLIEELSVGRARTLLQDGTIQDGMIPKTETCVTAVEKGVGAAVIIDGRVPHALLLEIFTEHGVGTLFRPGA